MDETYQFTLSFSFQKHFMRVINKCFNFVSSKKMVKIFQLDLSLSKNEHRRYTFPFKLISSNRPNLSPFLSLKVSGFNNVDLTTGLSTFSSSTVPFLRNYLFMNHDYWLNLKDLEIGNCYDCDFIKIHNVNLVSFKYIGKKLNLLLENVTSLLTTDLKMTQALICERLV